MSQTLDMRGQKCPQPVIQTKVALEAMGDGVLEVIVDNEAARDNILRFASFKKCQAAASSEKAGEFVVRITKGHPKAEPKEEPGPQPKPAPKAEPAHEPRREAAPPRGEVIILVTTARIGDDNEALGRELMGSFLDVLTQATRLPDRIIFINAGVTLTTEGSAVLGTLQELEGKGVKIVSCGRCLEYLHVKEELRVGTITNMFEAVEALTSAASVVKL